jgi:hypothetical protein
MLVTAPRGDIGSGAQRWGHPVAFEALANYVFPRYNRSNLN